MKKQTNFFQVILLILSCSALINAQSSFSPDDYIQFLEDHTDYNVQEFLGDNPPKTTYYSTRQYPANLSEIPWYDSLDSRYQFTKDENELLRNNFFMVSERLGSYDWASAFIGLYSSDLPLFLSSDFILSTLHSSYDAILQSIEWQFLEPNLLELLHAMYDYFPALVVKYSGDERFHPVLKDVDLYISVALSLAEGTAYQPQFDTEEKYTEVMQAIEAEDQVDMTLFTENRARKLDFSQFTPRGHYNEEIYTEGKVITLEKYFKAMMWLGRIDFLLTAPPENPWEPDWTDDELRRMQLGAILLNEVLYECGKIENLTRHEEIISYMVGPDDNMTPGELKTLTSNLLTSSQDLFNEETFDSFMDELNASDDFGQKIMSNFFYVDPLSSDPGNLPVSYKLLGQKFLLDSYVFSEVVYDRIIYMGEKMKRALPDPLDVMAALGNEDALALLENELDSFNYSANMAGLKYLVESYDDNFWDQSLYNTWLGAIRTLNPPPTSNGLPYFMQTTAWHHEKLNTQLTSWAQLRHDNLLYGKQSYTGGTGCSYPYTFVEPYPELYVSLSVFAENASNFFSDVFGNSEVECRDDIINYYSRYAEIMDSLKLISIKQIEKIRLSENDVTFLKTMINEYMASGPYISGWYTDLFFDKSKGLSWDFTVADVHTQPTDFFGNRVGHVLHVGNGNINMGVFLAENPCNPGQYMAFAGPVSSFHKKVTSDFERLTDEQWREYFLSGYESYPERPDWVSSYLADKNGNSYPEGRMLKGYLFTGTSNDPGAQQQLLDYLLVFPNPASGEAHLRFVITEKSDFRLEAFDATGKMVHSIRRQELAPAEHDISLMIENWPKGIYLLRIGIGNQYMVRELVVS